MSSAATVDLTGLDRLTARFRLLVNPNAAPLMVTWENILDEDNRKGVLAGTGGDGLPLAPVTYRPLRGLTKKQKTLTVEQRLGQRPNKKRGRYAAFGSTANAAFNNLTMAQYQKLDGPPLAPRRQFSRVVTNYRQTSSQSSATTWEAAGFWDDVVSTKGVPFLRFHFDGIGQKRRDLRGLREWGRERARTTARNWMIAEVRKG